MKIFEVVICGDSYGYFKSEQRAIDRIKQVLRDKIFVMDCEDDAKLYEDICKELDEQGYSMEIEVNIFEHQLDMED